jgi:hypothetical protein
MSFFDHPGNLGATRGTLFTVHHADWPAYPQGEDFRMPLLQLTGFPINTEFLTVDHIDQSTLFAACVRGARLDEPFATRNFHVAVWYEDLIALDKKGFIEGVLRVNEREWEERQWQRLTKSAPPGAHLGYFANGEFVAINPNFKSDDDDPQYGELVMCRNNRIAVTAAGRDFISAELEGVKDEIMTTLGDRVADLFESQYYDTSIREACVQLEHEIRMYTGTDAFGDSLVERFIDQARSERRFLESYLRSFRQELRTVFRFIRNDFMHNLREADSAATLAVLFRVARARAPLGALQTRGADGQERGSSADPAGPQGNA